MTSARRLAPALAALLLAACSSKVDDLPPGATVTCTSSAQCPSGTTCQLALGRCVSLSVDDRTPPSLVAGSTSIAPSPAAAGTLVTVTFTVDEPLAVDPEIRFTGAPTTLGAPHRSGLTYTLSFPASPDDGEGVHQLEARLVDLVGNVAATVPLGQVTFDFQAPSAALARSGPEFARSGDLLEAVVAFSEPLGAAPTATAAGVALAATAGPGSNQWTFSRTLDGSETEGAADLDVLAADPAGNPLSRRFQQVATLDFTAPTVAQATIATPALRAGETFGAELRFSEPMGGLPTVTLVPAGGGASRAVTASAIDARTVALSYDVPLGAADGTFTLRLDAAADRAGNPVAPQALGTATLDSTPPAIGALASNHGALPYRATDTVTVTFTTDEPLAGTPAARLELSPLPLPLTCAAGGAAGQWSCQAALTGSERPESVVNVTVSATDLAGNIGLAATAVVLDFTLPRLLSAAPGRAAFAAGSTVTYAVTSSEPLAAPPTLAVTPAAAWATACFATPGSASATSFAWSCPVPSGADGAYAVSVSLADEAGNTAGPLPGTGFTVDTVAPDLASAVTVAPAKQAFMAGDRPSLSFTVSKDIALPVANLNTATPIPAPCTLTGPRAYTCTLARALAASDLPEGPATVLLTLTDAAGNVGYGSKALVLDYTPPALAGAAVTQLLPGPGNLLSSISALGPGSTLRVSLLSAEPLSASPSVTMVEPTTQETLSLTLQSASGTSFVYTLTLDATPRPPSTWTLYWSPVDLAGNRWPNGGLPPVGAVAVDGEAPPAPSIGLATSPDVAWVRIPWGSQATLGAPYLGLRVRASAVPGAEQVVAWDGGAASARQIGNAPATAGTFAVDLRSDPVELYLSTLDGAGNESPRVRVQDVEWTAGLAGKIPGSTFENPHRLVRRAYSARALSQPDDVEIAGTALGTENDGLTVTTGGAGLYRPLAGNSAPAARRNQSMAYDPARGRLVLYGGQFLPTGTYPGDTWEWDGQSWRQMIPLDPEGDGNPPTEGYWGMPMVADPLHGGVLLLGPNLWLWNGVSWRNLDQGQVSPGFRSDGGAAWDEARGVLVAFGGSYTSQTWEWDGLLWRDVTPAAAGDSPSARSGVRLVYDTAHQRVVAFGGMAGLTLQNDVWSWDGTRWTPVATAGTPPSARADAAVAWDAQRSELLVQGGSSAGPVNDGRTYVLRSVAGTPTWFDVTPAAGTLPYTSHVAARDQARNRVVMVGDQTSNQLWSWDGVGHTWSLLAPGDPEGDGNPALYSVGFSDIVQVGGTRDRTVYFDGNTRDTWEWNRASWTRVVAAGGPTARSGASLGAYGNDVILFGGSIFGSSVGDTWRWDGTTWTQLIASPVRSPLAHYTTLRERVGMAARSDTGVLYRFGGSDQYSGGLACYSDLFSWNGTAWVQVGGYPAAWSDPEGDGSPTSFLASGDSYESCSPRNFTTWDASRGSLLVYSDSGPETIWEWLPASNSWRRHAMTYLASHLYKVAFFYDNSLQAPVLLANGSGWVANLATDTWLQIPTANLYGLSPPVGGVAAFDEIARRLVQVEQTTWNWESGTATLPAHLFHVDYSRANGPDPAVCVDRAACPIQGIDVRWRGTGAAPLQNGALLQAWTGDWTNAFGTVNSAALQDIAWSWTPLSAFPASNLFHGAARELTFALVPASGSTAAGTAQVTTDAVEVTVRYRRP